MGRFHILLNFLYLLEYRHYLRGGYLGVSSAAVVFASVIGCFDDLVLFNSLGSSDLKKIHKVKCQGRTYAPKVATATIGPILEMGYLPGCNAHRVST